MFCMSVPLIQDRPPALALASGHGRYKTATPERTIFSVGERPLHTLNRYKFVTVSILKRLRNGRFASETATWIQKRSPLYARGDPIFRVLKRDGPQILE
jgi:hypothetical protein